MHQNHVVGFRDEDYWDFKSGKCIGFPERGLVLCLGVGDVFRRSRSSTAYAEDRN